MNRLNRNPAIQLLKSHVVAKLYIPFIEIIFLLFLNNIYLQYIYIKHNIVYIHAFGLKNFENKQKFALYCTGVSVVVVFVVQNKFTTADGDE